MTGTNVKTSENSRGAFVCGSVFRGRGWQGMRAKRRETSRHSKGGVACVAGRARLSTFNGEGESMCCDWGGEGPSAARHAVCR